MSKPKTLGVVITDGVGYRNFVLSTFLAKAKKEYDKIVLFSGLPIQAYPQEILEQVQLVALPVYIEKRSHWFWRKLKEIAHLKQHKHNPGIADNLKMNYKRGITPRALLIKLIYILSTCFHSENAIRFYEKLQEQAFKDDAIVQQYSDLLKAYAPDILFFTHQRPPFIATLVYEARKLSIPTSAFIFSWDNLASKGRMAATFDQFLVWSNLMQEELLRFYAKVQKEQIHIVGTPQFEPYVLAKFKKSKSWLYDTLGLDVSKKMICYSCADKSIGANDPLIIQHIAQAIKGGVIRDVQLLVRTSPAERPDRFDEVKKQFPFIKWNFPQWEQTRPTHPEPWSQRIPTQEDLSILRAILEHADLNINMCSTMSLDFMLFDKPVINTVFGNRKNGLYDDQRFLKYEHYANVVESGAVKIARNQGELLDGIIAYLNNPSLDKENRKKLLDLQLGEKLENTTQACVNALKSYDVND